jgi:hypothetical protein
VGCSKTSFEGSISGRLESTGTTGKWVLDHGVCFSGERDGYFGARVDAREDNGVVVKFVKDPIKGWAVIANMADTCKSDGGHCLAKIFTKADCSTYQIDLKLDPTRKSQFFDGNVAIDCSVEGAHVFGKLALSACRAPWGK